jgi:hypothetical protein
MKSLKSALVILLFAALVSGIYLYATGDLKLGNVTETETEGEFLKSEEQFRNKLAELRMDREKLIRRKKLMEDRKAETISFLKEKGITSESDLSDKDVKYAINNLKVAVADVKEVEKNVLKYDDAIAAVEAMLVKMEQEAIANEVAVSVEKKIQMSAMIKELDDKLIGDEPDIIEEEKLRELLDNELDE